jgi:hypothetical protein
MKNIIIIAILCSSKILSAQMLTANTGPALNYNNDMNYRLAYTQKLLNKLAIGISFHYVGAKDNTFYDLANDNILEYRGSESNPIIKYPNFKRGIFSKNLNSNGASYSLQHQTIHIGLFVQYAIINKNKWNLGLRATPQISISRIQYYSTVLEDAGTVTIEIGEQPKAINFHEKEVTSLKELSIAPAIYANYKLTSNFWLGVDYSMPFYIVGGVDILPSLSISYLF